jgi:hypothetical protein
VKGTEIYQRSRKVISTQRTRDMFEGPETAVIDMTVVQVDRLVEGKQRERMLVPVLALQLDIVVLVLIPQPIIICDSVKIST